MTSRIPRDTRLRLVPRQPLAAAHRSEGARRRRSAPRPPAGVPPRDQLARQARACLGDAVRLARWAERTGLSPVTAAERAAADLRIPVEQVSVQWDRARLAGLIELHGDTALPGWRLRAWDRDDSAVLRGWVALFDAWSLAHPAPADVGPAAVGEVVVAAPQFLSVMHLSSGPVTVPALLDLLRQRIAELRAERGRDFAERGRDFAERGRDFAERGRDFAERGDASPDTAAAADTAAADTAADTAAVDADLDLPALLDWALDGLASVGALTRCAADAEGRPGQAVLTPLGNWAVWVKLEQICVAAQSPAGNIEHPAEDMLRGCARLSPGEARAEYRAWLAARTTGPAVAELLDAARGEDALIRGLAFDALRVVGAPAEPAVRAASAEPTLRPYALLWLAEHEGADPGEPGSGAPGVLTREEATWLWVDTAAAVADHGEGHLLVEHLGSAVQGSVPALLEEVRATGHPRTVQVLVALAAAHPDPALAKAVRRAAFQVHTGER
ncbi:hypothetical protein CUT44_06545 [Streptomyces carminius]|uniref:Uncharacterized protein n=1 Tax=Streptomyces carminius TaxID=2665496 RepID=A0A2M8M306_9ACTN|nr:hypothetical protein [Streptomyces carminius]PJE98584.1 hypothetical protein CUT44_06545 [Streptomyces carminius]